MKPGKSVGVGTPPVAGVISPASEGAARSGDPAAPSPCDDKTLDDLMSAFEGGSARQEPSEIQEDDGVSDYRLTDHEGRIKVGEDGVYIQCRGSTGDGQKRWAVFDRFGRMTVIARGKWRAISLAEQLAREGKVSL